MLACLQNFIGFRAKDCCEDWQPSESGLYIEDLEGLSIKKINSITDDRYKGAFDLARKRIDFAAKLICEEAMLRSEGLDFRKGIEKLEFGKKSGTILDPQADARRGIEFLKPYSPLSVLKIEEIRLNYLNSLPADFKIFISESDTLSIFPPGTSLDSDDCKVENTGTQLIIRPNYTSKSCYTQVYAYGDFLTLDRGVIDKDCLQNIGCGCGFDGAFGSQSGFGRGIFDYIDIRGFNGTTYNQFTQGFEIKATFGCDDSLLTCAIAPLLKLAILYRSGVEILNEFIATDRMGYLTIHGAEKTKEKIAEWTQKSLFYLEGALPQIEPMLHKFDKLCFECRGKYQVRSLIP